MQSRIVTTLKDICRDNLLHEKWVIAPSLRVGYQWLEQIAKSGQPVMNAHVKTLRRIVLDIASDYMNENHLEFLTGIKAEMLAYDIFSKLENEIGYLSKLNLSRGLVQTMLGSVYDLRLAGLNSENITPENFEVMKKGMDIKALMREYESELRDKKMIDYAGVLRISIDEIKRNSGAFPNNILLLMPENIREELHGLELDFWKAIPAGIQKILNPDKPNMLTGSNRTDASLLTLIQNPDMAPLPLKDGTAHIFRARGEVNEIRRIFRKCLEQKIPFDEVEILYTESAIYLPLIYEYALQFDDNDDGSIPVTFAEGIPIYYSHPARALLGLLSWKQDNYLQASFVKMLQDHLLKFDEDGEPPVSVEKIVSELRRLPIGVGRDRYEKAIEVCITPKNADTLKLLLNLIRSLFKCLPLDNDVHGYLEGIKVFLNRHARSSGKFDQYCREMLVGKIDELLECLKTAELEHLDINEWLYNMVQTSKAGGQGPRAECVYAAPVFAGGHSGRKYTFIIGLDDSRFPGSGRQDPLLLDHERDRISPGMPTASEHLSKTVERFAGLLAGLRGNVTMSYSCYDMIDDSEKFASSVLLSAYRIISGIHDGDQTDLLEWLQDPVSFSPSQKQQCANIDEWWMHHLCGPNNIININEIIERHYPHLARGLKALEARASDLFTHYDGYVPEAGPDNDPMVSDEISVSASMLEMLGGCPLEYFFRYVLKIKPPDEYVFDPGKWLNPLDKGSLLHSVFYEFMTELKESGKRPNFKEHESEINGILDKYIALYESKFTPPNRDIFEREKKQLYDTVRIFLLEEEQFSQQYVPTFFEVSLGLKTDEQGSRLDSPNPIRIKISDSKSVLAKGRIDRLDRVSDADNNTFCIWDYKTGGSSKYNNHINDPFAGGRIIQNILYILMAESHLKDRLSSEASITGFGYFFPSLKEHGHRIEWGREILADGKIVLANLCAMIASGCFPNSNDSGDVKYSDYKIAYGNIDKQIESMKKKMENESNEMLAPFRKLRPDKKKK